MSPKAASLAEKAGYKNVKVYIAGMPAWKKANKLVVVDNAWLAKNLDPHHVIIDVRPEEKKGKSQIKTAVHVEAGDFQQMGQNFKAKRIKYSKRILPGLADKKAPIILYAEDTDSPDVLAAFKSMVETWRYKNVAVLSGGFKAWHAKGFPAEAAAVGTKITYIKKPVKGSISPSEFAKLQKADGVVILDVRTNKEAEKGKIKNAILIPLDELEANLGKLSKSDKIVVHCSTGVRAGIAYNLLQKKGYNVSFLNSIIIVEKSGSYRIE
jgi:rhodanese-related sulfurtransferase